MIRDKLIFLLLLPFSLLYGLIIFLRNLFYDKGVLKSAKFDLPVISIGNLSVGGAGKTPHIEYLIFLLKDHLQIATMSRGYKRKTIGYLEIEANMESSHGGDEPLQFKRKFPEIKVSVSESRVLGIPKLVGDHPDIQVILLDDAFQHRSVQPGLNILLTEYSKPYYRDFLLPSGRLREWPEAAARADIIIVTKCPKEEQKIDKDLILEKLNPKPHQKVYFTYYTYGDPYYMYNPTHRIRLQENINLVLVTAIAGTGYLEEYLQERSGLLHPLSFEDHHDFTNRDIGQIKKVYENMDLPDKIILTTEKDAMRLDQHRDYLLQHKMPIFLLPLRVQFHFGEEGIFNESIKNFLLDFRS